ncbi:MAG: 50S ribosome-binding GTPase, partial [Candidatus Lokiarchaeota archaeon]|nr:50S ribosome-binding GTPase [Candidatus Lokiarchaeota archaeon]
MPEKITLIGRAGVGKTSIIKVMFEGENPKDLINNPLEPTRGIIPKIYSWMDIELSIFDTSGQEL